MGYDKLLIPHKMATRSWSSACPASPLIKESWDPLFWQPLEVSLEQAISLILGLQNQVLRLKRELKETKEATKEAQDWMGAGWSPHTPEDRKPPAVEATPRPIPKTNPLPAPSTPLISWANPTKTTFAQPTPVRAPLQVHTPPPPLPI
ncbi:hypothetical protein RhiXN_08177 [Rhizoctonia solani]|uniref:Uncharacterized protein n=1 Tax=Rhizoctonia solani TaxID=456999 RepID=A0A8H8SYF0_9AGAM|nr:uncharacterized protein RhiXN_08177 [Rhizoctonia solani]QRW23141.1 hypothetical protein RhiXN_08177 [Rhizoctonia solani]